MGMSDRILCILEVNQISRAEFARRLQITQAYVSKLINKGAEPSSRHMDYITKTTLYSEAGVREYWIVDPVRSSVTVYSYEKDAAPTIYLFEHTIPCGIFDDLKICIRDLLQ